MANLSPNTPCCQYYLCQCPVDLGLETNVPVTKRMGNNKNNETSKSQKSSPEKTEEYPPEIRAAIAELEKVAQKVPETIMLHHHYSMHSKYALCNNVKQRLSTI